MWQNVIQSISATWAPAAQGWCAEADTEADVSPSVLLSNLACNYKSKVSIDHNFEEIIFVARGDKLWVPEYQHSVDSPSTWLVPVHFIAA